MKGNLNNRYKAIQRRIAKIENSIRINKAKVLKELEAEKERIEKLAGNYLYISKVIDPVTNLVTVNNGPAYVLRDENGYPIFDDRGQTQYIDYKGNLTV